MSHGPRGEKRVGKGGEDEKQEGGGQVRICTLSTAAVLTAGRRQKGLE
jgi:hypothetical protein